MALKALRIQSFLSRECQERLANVLKVGGTCDTYSKFEAHGQS